MTLKQSLVEELNGKRILLLGFGREGQASLQFLNQGASPNAIGVADRNSCLKLPSGVTPHLGEDYLSVLPDYDLIIKAPGIPLAQELWDLYGEKITSQTELFLRFFKGQTIGITGTKGKTTMSSSIYKLAEKQKVGCLVSESLCVRR